MKTLTQSFRLAAVAGWVAVTTNLACGQVPVETKTTTTSTGTVSEFTPDAIAVQVNTSPVPVRYRFTKTTTYVDEKGNPVSVETVKTGVPVEVYYEKNGDNFVADKVVVEKSVATTSDASAAAASPATPPSIDGTIAKADSDEISIRTATSAGRLHYKARDATAYVDENGNPVARSTLQKGTPVTIFYERHGDGMLATRVVVKNSTPVEKTTVKTEETTAPQ